MSINKVILVGNLGAAPELKKLETGRALANFSLATNTGYYDDDGKWVKKTEWHRIATFGNVAETCHRYLDKGRQVYVEGKLSNREWTDKEGIKRYITEIVAYRVEFLGSAKKDMEGIEETEEIEEKPANETRKSRNKKVA